ncbi:carbohydrate binding-domain-containing protein [Mycena galopus ATCC 62051]|nr:carbohydrate binding-domain-containing protein [Mycena galopus ATCC 62051]
MVQLISFVLTAVFASIGVVAADNLENCGSSKYYPSQYTCFDNSFLCPILNGDKYLKCGNACYSTSQYSCYDGDFLCPVQYGVATLKCGTACYNPTQYDCTYGQLGPVGQY